MLHRLAESAVRFPVPWLVAFAAGTAVFIISLKDLEIRVDGAALRPLGNPVVSNSEDDEKAFADTDETVVLVTSEHELSSPEGLRLLRDLHKQLESVDGLGHRGVRSVMNLPILPAPDEDLSFETLEEFDLSDEATADSLLRRVRQNPICDGLFLSADGKSAAIYVSLAGGTNRPRFLAAVGEVVQGFASPGVSIRVTGPSAAETALGDVVLKDLFRLVPLMIAVIALILFVSLRTAGGVLIPLLEALVTLIWTLGLMSVTGVPVTLVTTILPVVLMTMAITDEIHLLERVQRHMTEDGGGQRPAAGAVARSLREVGRPIVATSLTTAFGLLSFLSATIWPIRHFGLFAAAGVVLAMLMTFTLIPALAVTFPASWLRGHGASHRGGRNWESRLVNRTGWGWILGLAAVLVAAPGIARLEVEDAWVDNFDPRADVVTADSDFNDAFWGSYRFDVVLEAGEEYFLTPAGVRIVEAVVESGRTGPGAGGVVSYATPLREVAKSFGVGGRLDELSEKQLAELAMAARLWTGAGSLDELLSIDGAEARVRVFAKDTSYRQAVALESHLREALAPLAGAAGVSYHFSGDLPIAEEVVGSVVTNQIRSIGWALAAIAFFLVLALRSLRTALVVLVPVVSSTVLVYGILGYAGVPLGVASSMFASVVLGVGVDFGLHIHHRFRSTLADRADPGAAMAEAWSSTGRAIRWNALTLAGGFVVLAFSGIRPNHLLGLLLSVSMVVCYAVTFLVVPRILRWKRLSVGLLLIAVWIPGAAGAQEESGVSGRGAEAIMRTIRDDFMKMPRLLRMKASSDYPTGVHQEHAFWGLVSAEGSRMRILYVFTHPERQRGTSLLLDVSAESTEQDSTWLFFSAAKKARRIRPEAQWLTIPGTGLSYADARGYLPLTFYEFDFGDGVGEGDGATLWAKPKTDAIRRTTKYDSLVVELDAGHAYVRRVEFFGEGGRHLKSYRVKDVVFVDGVPLPKIIEIENYKYSFTTTIENEYWALEEAPPREYFQSSVAASTFLDRVVTVMASQGIEPDWEWE